MPPKPVDIPPLVSTEPIQEKIQVVDTPVRPGPPPAFDPNDPSTWPSCPAGDIVRADNGQCAAPAQTTAPIQIASTSIPVQSDVISGCGDNYYANYIYMHESGCNVNSVNSLGCRGIGQACPGDKLPCGSDYACQNAYFTNYAISTYGGWTGAYQHWLAYSWW